MLKPLRTSVPFFAIQKTPAEQKKKFHTKKDFHVLNTSDVMRVHTENLPLSLIKLFAKNHKVKLVFSSLSSNQHRSTTKSNHFVHIVHI